MDIFGVCRSHVYRMLREGELDYADNRRPAKVTKQSVLAAIKRRLPFLASLSSLHYAIEARAGWSIDESDIHVAIQTSVELLDACNRLTRATSATADNDVAEATA